MSLQQLTRRQQAAGILFLLVGFFVTAACGGTDLTAPTGFDSPLPAAGRDSATLVSSSVLDVATENAPGSRNEVLEPAATVRALGDTNVPLVSRSLCGFSASNPYPCCQNSIGKYGNCTGWAWEAAKNAGWGSGLPPGWSDARTWRNSAIGAGYLVDVIPTVGSIGIANNGPTLKNHVAYVVSFDGANVQTTNQQCGEGLSGGRYTDTRAYTNFNDGFIRAPIPTVTLQIWSGAVSASNSGTLTVKKPVGSGVTVTFGFSQLRANINTAVKGPSRFVWTVAGAQASTEGTFSKKFTSAGTYPIAVRVTNGMNVTTAANATLVVR